MERRLILAIALSLLVLLSWSAFVSKTYHIDNKEVKEKSTPYVTVAPLEVPTAHLEQEILPLPLFKLSQENYEIAFIEPQAAIKEVIFKAYQSHKFPLKNGFLLGDKHMGFKKESISPESVTFVYSDKDKKIIKRFIFSKSNYDIWLEIEIQNLSITPINTNLPLVLGVLNFVANPDQARFQDVTLASKDKPKPLHLNGRKEFSLDTIKFLGLRDRYFCVIIEPESGNYTGFIKKLNPQESEIGLSSKEIGIAAGQQITQRFHIYLGPQDLRIINSIKSHWSAVMHYGAFNFLSRLLLQLLEFLYHFVHNWGWAIVILSIIIYIILYPLTLKQMRSMKHMQALQPAIEELRKTYKDNPQKLNKEIMGLYRQEKINPFGGCLPLILQIPIFFALYQALMRAIHLKGAHFLWIKDLSGPDKLFSPIILGNKIDINILPILMAIGMFIQQKISVVTTGSGTKEQQKLMTILFPLMFGFIFYRMPSGLVLYWFINSTLMLLYQIHISRTR